MIAPNSRRAGFTLLEMLCVMMLLTLVLMIVTLMFRETLRVEQIQSAGFDRILQSKALADQFRGDVARAEADEKEWHLFKADASTLILRMKDKTYVVYHRDDRNLIRHVFLANDAEQTIALPIGRQSTDVEFMHADKQRVVRLRLHPLRDGNREAGNALEFAAALGGDWR
jgi:prepilin-type N-terminal cleavage/methylation domain-containing protein